MKTLGLKTAQLLASKFYKVYNSIGFDKNAMNDVNKVEKTYQILFYNKQFYFMKSICWNHIWSYKNTNLLNINEGLYFLYMWPVFLNILNLNCGTMIQIPKIRHAKVNESDHFELFAYKMFYVQLWKY